MGARHDVQEPPQSRTGGVLMANHVLLVGGPENGLQIVVDGLELSVIERVPVPYPSAWPMISSEVIRPRTGWYRLEAIHNEPVVGQWHTVIFTWRGWEDGLP